MRVNADTHARKIITSEAKLAILHTVQELEDPLTNLELAQLYTELANAQLSIMIQLEQLS